MKKVMFVFFNIFVLAGMPTILTWAVGGITVRKQLEWFCKQNNIWIPANQISNYSASINNHFFVWRTLVMIAYSIFLSLWVIHMLPKFIGYLQSIND